MADLPEELKDLGLQFGDLSRFIPTRDLQEFQQVAANVALTLGQSSSAVQDLSRDFATLSAATGTSRDQLARMTMTYTTEINKAIISFKNYQNLAGAIARIDPFNTSQRMDSLMRYSGGVDRLARTIDPMTGKIKDMAAAQEILNRALGDGNQFVATTIRGLQAGVPALDNYTTRLQKLKQAQINAAINITSGVTESPVGNFLVSVLSSPQVANITTVLGGLFAAKVAKDLYGFFSGGGGHGGGMGGGGMPPGGGGSAASGFVNGPVATAQAAFAASRVGGLVGKGMSKYGRMAGWGGLALATLGYLGSTLQDNGDPSHNKSGNVLGGALSGASVGATIGSFIPVPGGGLMGAGIGAGIGALLSYFSSSGPVAKSSKEAADDIGKSFEEMAGKAQERIKFITAGFSEGNNIDKVRRDTIAVRMEMAQTLSSIGVQGPQAFIKASRDMISSLKLEYQRLQEARDQDMEAARRSGGDVESVSAKYEQALTGVQKSIIDATMGIRRSWFEQMLGGAINLPSGTTTMPGGLSKRQLYGGSYMDTGTPMGVDITTAGHRAWNDKYSATTASFNPIISQVQASVGRAGGGIIPGPASSVDNTLAHVASGEYVVQASAVSHYGKGFFDRLNNRSLPARAGGGIIDDWLKGNAMVGAMIADHLFPDAKTGKFTKDFRFTKDHQPGTLLLSGGSNQLSPKIAVGGALIPADDPRSPKDSRDYTRAFASMGVTQASTNTMAGKMPGPDWQQETDNAIYAVMRGDRLAESQKGLMRMRGYAIADRLKAEKEARLKSMGEHGDQVFGHKGLDMGGGLQPSIGLSHRSGGTGAAVGFGGDKKEEIGLLRRIAQGIDNLGQATRFGTQTSLGNL